ncbi:hypothetical protein YWS52_13480 [Chitiniphilus shinanonensis]
MRLERQQGGLKAAQRGRAAQFGEHGAVAEVQAIEVADGQGTGGKGGLGRAAEKTHGARA